MPRGDSIYNGAVDNATGTAALLEMARVFAQWQAPERSVVFLAVTAEERGLLGSEYYAANPLYPLETTVAVINMDALSPWGPARDFSMAGSAKLDLLDRSFADAKPGNAVSRPSETRGGFFFRSDHFPFAKRGVPAISFDSGEDRVDGGVKAGRPPPKTTWRIAITSRRTNGTRSGHSPACSATWNFSKGGRGPCEFGALAELVSGFGVPRSARRHRGRAQVKCRPSVRAGRARSSPRHSRSSATPLRPWPPSRPRSSACSMRSTPGARWPTCGSLRPAPMASRRAWAKARWWRAARRKRRSPRPSRSASASSDSRHASRPSRCARIATRCLGLRIDGEPLDGDRAACRGCGQRAA